MRMSVLQYTQGGNFPPSEHIVEEEAEDTVKVVEGKDSDEDEDSDETDCEESDEEKDEPPRSRRRVAD